MIKIIRKLTGVLLLLLSADANSQVYNELFTLLSL